MNLKNLKLFLLSVISICTFSIAKSQITEPVNPDLLFSKTQIGVNLGGNLSHFIVSPQTGPNAPRSWVSPGFDGNVNLIFNMNKTTGVKIGIGGGLQSFNYIVTKDNSANGKVTQYSGTGSQIGYLSIPIDLTARKRIGENIFLYGDLGVDVRFYDSFDGLTYYTSGDSNTTAFLKYNEVTNSGPRTLVVPEIGVGIYLQLPYNDLLSVQFTMNLGQYEAFYVTYNYFDFRGNNTGSGTYFADASFIGLNIGYVFTRVRSH